MRKMVDNEVVSPFSKGFLSLILHLVLPKQRCMQTDSFQANAFSFKTNPQSWV
eukprot:c51114_g1_i1 orf=18-176(+)